MKKHINLGKRGLATGVMAAGLLLVSGVSQAMPVVVSNGLNDGEGSFRAALESGAREIVVATSDEIMITETLVYEGERPIAIYGAGQTVKAMDDFTLLEVSNGASLTVVGLTFEGPGGFDINSQSTAESPGKGIFVDVRDDQTGRVQLTLRNVTVRGVANHGVHVSDCNLADDCGSGGGGAGEGSAAAIGVEFTNVIIDDVGNGKFDADGLRVDERGVGNILFVADGSNFVGVGADGVELDEGQEGEVIARVTNSTFDGNGLYCDPDQLGDELETFLAGEDDEGEFEESEEVIADLLPGPVTGSSDDRCFEYAVDTFGSGFVEAYEYAIDVDDAFDIDEAGPGSLRSRVINVSIVGNFDEGVDFDEEDAGDIKLVAANAIATDNTDDGFKLSEEGEGSVQTVFVGVTAEDNGGKGFVFEEADAGNINALVSMSETDGNDDGDVGIEVVQEDAGSGRLVLRDTTVNESEVGEDFPVAGVEADGVTVSEQ
ncbi:MAG: hypothetical protein HRT76_02335 [Halieaceae bacterium]|nr:hypothetical protein [Halieaceae bacterium]